MKYGEAAFKSHQSTVIIFLTGLLLNISVLYSQDYWVHQYGGPEDDQAWSAIATSDSACLIVGDTYSFGSGSSDFWIIKTDLNGDTLWTRTFGGVDYDDSWSVIELDDHNYIISGQTFSQAGMGNNAKIVCLDLNGNLNWTREYGGPGNQFATSAIQADSTTIVFAGYEDEANSGTGDVWLLATNLSGDSLWTRTYSLPGATRINAAAKDSEGQILLVGSTQATSDGEPDVFLLSILANGDSLWSRRYGFNSEDEAWACYGSSDGGFVVGGRTVAGDENGKNEAYFLKVTQDGDTLWAKHIGRDEGGTAIFALSETSDGSFLLGGTLRPNQYGNDGYLLSIDEAGNEQWSRSFGGNYTEDCVRALIPADDGGFIAVGYTSEYSAGGYDIWLVKTDSMGFNQYNPVSIHEPILLPAEYRIMAFPNPFNPTTTIRYEVPTQTDVVLTIYDISGRFITTLEDSKQSAGAYSVQWNGIDMLGDPVSTGVYFCRLQAGASGKTTKLVYLKQKFRKAIFG